MKWLAWVGAAIALILLLVLAIDAARSQTVGVTMLWTAPGDDGTVGRASQYDLRYSAQPISGVDTLSWWNAATQALGEPVPGVSGTTDSVRVLGLAPSSRYYFIIKSADEVPNWSGYSNVAIKDTPDLIPPARILDLR